MNPIERVMRLMIHLNIGATLGMAAWIVWSGLSLVAPAELQIAPTRGTTPDVRDRRRPADAPSTPQLEAQARLAVGAFTKARS